MATNETTTINDEEFTEAVEAAAKATDTFTLKLAKHITINDTEFAELEFKFADLTGADSLAIEQEMSVLGLTLIAPTFSGQYLARMAARACTTTIGTDTINRMSIGDFNRLRNAARSFLLKTEL